MRLETRQGHYRDFLNIDLQKSQRKELAFLDSYEDYAKQCLKNALEVKTYEDQSGKIIFIIGLTPTVDVLGTYLVWSLMAQDAGKHLRTLYKSCLQLERTYTRPGDTLITNSPSGEADRWLTLLGFQRFTDQLFLKGVTYGS